MAFGGGSDLFVTSQNAGEVLRYNWKTGAYLGVFASGISAPGGVLYDGNTNSLYVSEFSETGGFDGHRVLRYNATTGAATGTFDAGAAGGLADMALGADGKLYVSNFYYGQVLQFDPANASAPPVVFAQDAALSGSNGLLFHAGKLDVVGLMSQNVVQFNANGSSAGQLVSAASQYLYFPSDAVIDPDGNLLVSCLGNNSNPLIPYAPGYIGKFNASSGAAINPYFIMNTNPASWIQPTAMLIEPYAVWSGGATGSTSWTNAANWGGAAPAAPAAVRFGAPASGGHTENFNNFPNGTQFNGITFSADAPAYTLQGEAILLGGPVVNLSAVNQVIDLPMTLGLGGGSFDTGSHNITLTKNLDGTGALTKKAPAR